MEDSIDMCTSRARNSRTGAMAVVTLTLMHRLRAVCRCVAIAGFYMILYEKRRRPNGSEVQ